MWVGAGLFFNAYIQLGAGLPDDLLSVLLGELLVLVVTLNGLLDRWDFVLRQVTAGKRQLRFPGERNNRR